MQYNTFIIVFIITFFGIKRRKLQLHNIQKYIDIYQYIETFLYLLNTNVWNIYKNVKFSTPSSEVVIFTVTENYRKSDIYTFIYLNNITLIFYTV